LLSKNTSILSTNKTQLADGSKGGAVTQPQLLIYSIRGREVCKLGQPSIRKGGRNQVINRLKRLISICYNNLLHRTRMFQLLLNSLFSLMKQLYQVWENEEKGRRLLQHLISINLLLQPRFNIPRFSIRGDRAQTLTLEDQKSINRCRVSRSKWLAKSWSRLNTALFKRI